MENNVIEKRMKHGKIIMIASAFLFLMFILLSRSNPDHGFLTNLLNYMIIGSVELDYPIFHDTFLCTTTTRYSSLTNTTHSFTNCTNYLKTKYFLIFTLALFVYGLMVFANLSPSPKEVYSKIFRGKEDYK